MNETPEYLAQRTEKLQRASGIPGSWFYDRTFETFQVSDDNRKAFNTACLVCCLHPDTLKPWSNEDWDRMETQNTLPDIPCFLTFLGEPGTGKSHLAVAIAEQKIAGGEAVKYWQVEDFLDALRSGFEEKESQKIFDETKDASVLILDDFGAEKDTEWAGAKLDQLIDFRYRHCEDFVTLTIICSNLSPKQWGKRISSRLSSGAMVVLKGADRRPLMRAKSKNGGAA